MPGILMLLLALLTLPGCALVEVEPDPASPFYPVPEGSVLEIHQPITIPAGRTRVWLQRGRVVAGQDWWHPACNLEVNTLDRERRQTVGPGRFDVIRVQGMDDFAQQQIPAGGVMNAGLYAGYDNGGNTWMWRGHHLWLSSAEQPDVLRLTCVGVYARAHEVRPPSIEQIREALGPVASLRLP